MNQISQTAAETTTVTDSSDFGLPSGFKNARIETTRVATRRDTYLLSVIFIIRSNKFLELSQLEGLDWFLF